MGDRREPKAPPTDQVRPAPPPAPPPRRGSGDCAHLQREVNAAHATLDRFGIERYGIDSIDKRGKSHLFTRTLSDRIEELHRSGS